MTMQLSEAGAAFIGRHEGFVPRWYLDPVGVPTIGKGFTFASAAFRAWWDDHRPGQRFERDAAAGGAAIRSRLEGRPTD